MADSETFAGRLKTYIDEKKISIWDFERLSGLKKGIINNAIRGNAFIGSDKLALIITNFTDLNPVWLLTGNGDMLLPEEKKVQITNGDKNIVANGDMVYHAPHNPTSEDIYIEKINGLQALLDEKQRHIESLIALIQSPKKD